MLNTQFRKGYPANIPERAGVMIHMIDDLIYSLELPWLPCTVESLWCYKYSDRCSASIINEELPYVYDHNFKSIGIVLAPWLVDVMCSFFVDGGTMLPDKTCDTPGISPTCLPGCWKGEANWCDDDQRIFNCAWPPNALSKMLKRHIHRMDGRPWAGFPYNEVILSTTGWKEKLPELIQAFFVLAHRPEEKAVAKHIHKRFRFFYPNSEVPLLELDLWGDLQTPFSYVLV